MKEHPILFSTPMVKAILEKRKTMTRRICKHQNWSFSELTDVNENNITQKKDRSVSCPYGQIGDLLWVRENTIFTGYDLSINVFFIRFCADNQRIDFDIDESVKKMKFRFGKIRPSIHMPKSAARIWLQVTNIKVERLNDISSQDAIHEGIQNLSLAAWKDYQNDNGYYSNPKASFQSLWMKINCPVSWLQNPWVWVVEFEVISTTGKPNNI